MLHPIQRKILNLSKDKNIAQLSLRKTANLIRESDSSPQKIKHHILQLQKKGFLSVDGNRRVRNQALHGTRILKNRNNLFSIPIIGIASCGALDIFAEENFDGFLHISKRMISKSSPNGLFAIRARGFSMNLAEIHDNKIEDGDFIIVDKENKNIINNSIVLVVIDGMGTIKRFIRDRNNNQIVLKSDSSFDYEPIYLHPRDDFFISGKVIDVIKKPKSRDINQ